MPNYAKHMKLKGENEGLRQQLAECRARNADLDRELVERGQEMEQVNSVENLLHCQLDHADGEIIDLTSVNDVLRQQLAEAKAELRAWRAGYIPEEIVVALEEKQRINFAREWFAPTSQDIPVEHVKEADHG